MFVFSILFQTKKISEIDQLNKEQEVKFMSYLSGNVSSSFLSMFASV